MSFSRPQQSQYRQFVRHAWLQHCRDEQLPIAPMDRDWYEAELVVATGHRTTSECNAGRDYDHAMAHFEALARAGVKWQLKLSRGDAIRLAHNIREVCANHDLDEDFMRGIARQALRLDTLPELVKLSPDDLMIVLRACKQHVTRHLVREGKRQPQISRKTFMAKPPQVKAYFERDDVEEPF